MKRHVLVLGASYGSLFATKLLMAGHDTTLVCTRATADLIGREGTRVAFPVKGVDGLVEVASTGLPGRLRAQAPAEVDPDGYDLIVLGMQEAQYASPGVRELLARVARSRRPCFAIMNMPPLPYLARIGLPAGAALADCYTDASVWDGIDPERLTLASPDPQAFRPADRAKNVLQVGLPTNFKAARFGRDQDTAVLRALATDIERARYWHQGRELEIPVKLKVHESPFVPLAKWPMLIAGNYRCVRADGMVSIRDAVHADLDASRRVYAWVSGLCQRLGADPADLVPFEKYAAAAAALGKPSSAARALAAGAEQIERVDALVDRIAATLGARSDTLARIVQVVDERLRANRAAARAAEAPVVAAPAPRAARNDDRYRLPATGLAAPAL